MYGRPHNYGHNYADKAIITDSFQQSMEAFDKLRPALRDCLNGMLAPQDPISVLIEQKRGKSDKFLIDALLAFDKRWHKELVDKKEVVAQRNFTVKNLAAPASDDNTDQHPPVAGSVVSIAAVRAARLARQANRLSKLQARLRQRNPGSA